MGWSFKQKAYEEILPFWFCLGPKVSESFIEAPFCLLKKTYQCHTTPTKTSKKKVKIQTYQCQLRPLSNHLEPPWPGSMTNGNAVDGLRMKSTNRHRWTTCQTCVETTPMGPTKNSKMPSQTNSLDSFKISASWNQQLDLLGSKMNFCWPCPRKVRSSESYLEVRQKNNRLFLELESKRFRDSNPRFYVSFLIFLVWHTALHEERSKSPESPTAEVTERWKVSLCLDATKSACEGVPPSAQSPITYVTQWW